MINKQKWQQSFYNLDLIALFKAAINHVTLIEKLIFLINITIICISLIAFTINYLFINYYTPANYLDFVPASLFGLIVIWFWSSANRQLFPYLSPLLLSLVYMVISSAGIGILALATMLTPSPWVLSTQLASIDHFFGFYTMTYIHWAARHLVIAQILEWCYESWHWEVLFLAPLLVLFKQFKRGCAYLFYGSVLGLMCCLIYMIWPSLGPSYVNHAHMFPQSTYVCWHRFHLLRSFHHYVFGTCGLIVFPSYHVCLAVLAIWATWRVPLLNVISIIFNILVIIATLVLGYHFLVDVVVAILMNIIMLWIGAKWLPENIIVA